MTKRTLKELEKSLHEGMIDDIKKKYHIDKIEKGSIGFSEKSQKWYGWSHRAICGFKVGDKVFDEKFGDDDTPFIEHGKKPCKTLDDCKTAASNFAKYVS